MNNLNCDFCSNPLESGDSLYQVGGKLYCKKCFSEADLTIFEVMAVYRYEVLSGEDFRKKYSY